MEKPTEKGPAGTGTGSAAGTRDEAPARLILWRADPRDDDPVAQVLKTRFALDLRDSLPDLDMPGSGAGGAAPAGVVLLCPPAERSLCRAMARDVAPAIALADWQERTRAMLALQRRDRGRVRILDTAMIARHPRAFMRLFDLPGDEAAIAALSGSDPEADGGDEIMLLLAHYTLHGDIGARALLGELEAAMADLSDGAGAPKHDPDAGFARYQSLRRVSELLLEQNRAMYEEMEALQATGAQLEQRLEQLGEGLEGYRALQSGQEILQDKIADKNRALQGAGDLARDQGAHIAYLQSALEQANAGQAEARARVEELEGRIHQILTSRSFRLTEPLRRLRAMLAGKGRA